MANQSQSPNQRRWVRLSILFLLLSAMTLWAGSSVHGHGGKSHGGTGVSAFEVIQKATQLYDRLITSGKLPEDWETNLTAINVSKRPSGNQSEYIVQFQRAGGDPGSVFFFFNLKGEYSGSNFTGE